MLRALGRGGLRLERSHSEQTVEREQLMPALAYLDSFACSAEARAHGHHRLLLDGHDALRMHMRKREQPGKQHTHTESAFQGKTIPYSNFRVQPARQLT